MSGYWIKDTFWRGMAMIGLASSYPTHIPNVDYHPAIIITGTSSGIGKEAALIFARQGYTVIATVRQEAHVTMLITEFNTRLNEDTSNDSTPFIQGGSLHPVILDLSGKEQIAEGWQRIEAVLRDVDVPLVALINNAGYGVSWVFEWMDAEYWMQALWTNFLGAVELTRLALPRIRASKGRIINIGSIMAWNVVPCCSSYAASKAALALWTRTLRCELLPFDVAVTIIEPGK
jgi:NAD(P)-dependent dehydrogenase (short-subunit alcohol dehydrogenase family)